MPIRKIVKKPLNFRSGGVSVTGGINAAVTMNDGEPGPTTSTRVSSHNRVVQRNGRTVVQSTTTEMGDHVSNPKEDDQ